MAKKSSGLLKGLIDKQKRVKKKEVGSVNLEALVNSGRIRIGKTSLEQVKDKSEQRKKENN